MKEDAIKAECRRDNITLENENARLRSRINDLEAALELALHLSIGQAARMGYNEVLGSIREAIQTKPAAVAAKQPEYKDLVCPMSDGKMAYLRVPDVMTPEDHEQLTEYVTRFLRVMVKKP